MDSTTTERGTRRPAREDAENAVCAFLDGIFGERSGYAFKMEEFGDDSSAEGKCGWSFWIREEDTTSYVHEDLSIEWYGTGWTPGDPDEDDSWF